MRQCFLADFQHTFLLQIELFKPQLIKTIFYKKIHKKKLNLIIHCAAQPSHDWAKNKAFVDFEINAKGTLNLLELTKMYCPNSPFIFMSTNKVYGDNPNKLPLVEKKTRWEIKKNHKYYKKYISENLDLYKKWID